MVGRTLGHLTQRAFRGEWLFTGDVAYRAADGHFIQLDREVDVIHTHFGDVYTLLMEEKIHNHPAIFDACVYGERQLDGTMLPAWPSLCATVSSLRPTRSDSSSMKCSIRASSCTASIYCRGRSFPWALQARH
jgi:long-chain acyl-CoA synthetase